MPGGQSLRCGVPTLSSTSVDTQAIVIPGPHSRIGQGLRSGFKALCFSRREDQCASACEGKGQDGEASWTAFHVIFHDWYDEKEAGATQDMLENSDITCNACKLKIPF
jgi:hypothetical protein